MIKRELYMKRIRPFIGSDLVKVMTGIRRCGKSVMLELIKDELKASGVDSSQFISINFEDMRYTYLQTAQALHDEITKLASSIDGKVYLFFDEIQEVTDWEKCINSLRTRLTATFTLQVRMPNCCPANLLPILVADMLNLLFILFHLQNFLNCTISLHQMNQFQAVFKNILYRVVCHTCLTFVMPRNHPFNI